MYIYIMVYSWKSKKQHQVIQVEVSHQETKPHESMRFLSLAIPLARAYFYELLGPHCYGIVLLISFTNYWDD